MRPGAESERTGSWLLRQLQHTETRIVLLDGNRHSSQQPVTPSHLSCLSSTQVSWQLLLADSRIYAEEIGTAKSYLPQTEGLLPTWQLIVAVMAFFNAAQNFATLKLTRRIYGNVAPPLGSGSRVTLLVTAPADECLFCIQ